MDNDSLSTSAVEMPEGFVGWLDGERLLRYRQALLEESVVNTTEQRWKDSPASAAGADTASRLWKF